MCAMDYNRYVDLLYGSNFYVMIFVEVFPIDELWIEIDKQSCVDPIKS